MFFPVLLQRDAFFLFFQSVFLGSSLRGDTVQQANAIDEPLVPKPHGVERFDEPVDDDGPGTPVVEGRCPIERVFRLLVKPSQLSGPILGIDQETVEICETRIGALISRRLHVIGVV